MSKIISNRINSRRSTGPKTLAGKIRSSRNAFKHGFSAIDAGNDPENIERYLQPGDETLLGYQHGAQYAATRNAALEKIREASNLDGEARLHALRALNKLTRYRSKAFRRWMADVKVT